MIKKFSIFNFQFRITQKGFTLVELLVAVALFTLIATFALGAVLSIFDANRRAKSMKTVVDNLNFSIEDMARTIKFGGEYYCGFSSNQGAKNDCPIGSSGGASSISVTFEGRRIIYSWPGNNSPIRKYTDSSTIYTEITSPETRIEYVRFYVMGSTSGDSVQPRVLAIIKGYVGNKPTSQSIFSIQTLMSQRKLDI